MIEPERPPAATAVAAADLSPLEGISVAVESGAGLPAVVRAAGRALDASLAVLDRTAAVLAVAARSPADERALLEERAGVETLDLRVGDVSVGRLRLRPRSGPPAGALVRLVSTVVASEVERLRAPDRASEAAQAAFLRAVLGREVGDRDDLVARAQELGLDLGEGAAMVVARAHRVAAADEDWRARVLLVVERVARASAPGSLAAVLPAPRDAAAGLVVAALPTSEAAVVRRVADATLGELTASLPGFRVAVGFSRVVRDPLDLPRAGSEALLAANLAETRRAGESGHALAFEDTGSYRLLLPAMSEDPEELQRFYEETVGPLVAYDEQYETELVGTLETFLEADGNVAGTAQKLFTHRHTVRYRLERVRELTGLDVGSSDGRERLGLGLKAMRVLGIAPPRGPATEAGAEAGRVPRPGR